MIIVVICVFLVLVLTVSLAVVKGNYIQKLRTTVSAKYALDDLYISDVDYSLLGISFAEKNIVLGNHVAQRLFDWSQIASVEVIKDGVILTETNRRSQLSSAVLGEIAFGPLGALVGGLSGSTVGRNQITDLGLKIIVDDQNKPVFVVTFFRNRTKKGSAPNSQPVTRAKESMERMHGHLVNALRRSTTTYPGQQTAIPTPLQKPSVANLDEIQKLWELKEKNILTESEFLQQKAILLGSPVALPALLPQATPSNGTPRRRLILKDKGANKISTIKAVREVTGLGLNEALDLVNRAPTLLIEVNSGYEANEIIRRFERVAVVDPE